MRFSLLLFALLAAGCTNLSGIDPITGLPSNGARVDAPAEAPSIQGTLTQVVQGNEGGTLTIERDPAVTTGVPKATVRLTSKTLMIRPDGQRMSFRELSTGQTVDVWFEGTPTDPLQATARAVRLVR